MKSQKTSHGYLLVLKKGEQLVSSIEGFCNEHKVEGGFITGLGAVLEAELGYYDLPAKQYRWKKFSNTQEIVSLTGSISTLENRVNLHAHIVLSDEQYRAHGGHLKEAIVAGTCEILLRRFDDKLQRQFDEATGLNLLDL